MLMPGFSSPRVPVHVRLFIAVAVTLALAPLLRAGAAHGRAAGSGARGHGRSSSSRRRSIGAAHRPDGAHVLPRAAVHGDGRRHVHRLLRHAGRADRGDRAGCRPSRRCITLTATVLVFLTDQHWEMLRALLGLLLGAARSPSRSTRGLQPRQAHGRCVQRLHPGAADQRARSSSTALIINFMVGHRQQARAADPGLLHLDARSCSPAGFSCSTSRSAKSCASS